MLLTILSCCVIIVATIVGGVYIKKCKENNNLFVKRRWVEQIPSLISTLGVIGTFLGITVGLSDFNSNDITASIPTLLDGLKTAFYTSLIGMAGSLILSRKVSAYFDEVDKGANDLESMTRTLVSLTLAIQESNATSAKELTSQTKTLGELLATMQAVKKEAIETKSHTEGICNFVGEIVETSAAMASTNEDVVNGINGFRSALHGEVLDVEDKMEATNKLLSNKFDEFTTLLQKSNTEALVDVMKRVTEEFQKQMNALIGKLVSENFAQLNQSVSNLNTWQVENKEMISSLTSQYREMATNFESTSSTLSQVSTNARNLVGDGGKLQQLVESLGKVMVDDKNFVQIASNLTSTAELTKDNMEQFDGYTKGLNEWVKSQYKFTDDVKILIAKLEELNKIRDYGESFWNSTRKSMQEGVGIIAQGSKALNEQIQDLDQKFYARLSATLAELDACIQAMVNKK